jgi:hypothetical protein
MNAWMHVRSASAVLLVLAVMPAPSGATPVFSPTLEWAWTSSLVEPTSLNVMSTPSVIDLNGDGKPEVVFGSTASTGGGLVETGVLRVLNGTTGAEVFTVTDPALRIDTAASVATGDIDGDGRPEIIAVDSTGQRLIAFESDGTFKWRSQTLEPINWGAPAIADLNGDGKPEIIIGRQVLDNTGVLQWTGAGSNASGGNIGPLSLVSDVNLDGKPDVVAGNTVYDGNGAIQYRNTALPDGYNAVGNFDADPEAEIVLVSGGQVWLLNHDMSVKWGPVAIPGGGFGGAPTIADFDGDGQPEIGVAGANRYVVLETNGAIKWQTVTQDGSSNRTGSSVFDFENDGSAEVIYGDELFLRVYDGDNGTLLFQTPKSSCTWYEYPLVADVNADGHAEILATANNNCGLGPQRGVFLWGDPAWVDTRDVWNEFTYHITNVAQDGSIPTSELVNWQIPGLNNFRLNQYLPGEAPPSIPEPSSIALAALVLGSLAWTARRNRARLEGRPGAASAVNP